VAWYLTVVPGPSRVLLLDANKPVDVFDLVELTDRIARVRSAFLFELGEELRVRVEQDGRQFDAPARVRAHMGPDAEKITELELGERTPS